MISNAQSLITHDHKKIMTSTWCQNITVFIIYNWESALDNHSTCFYSISVTMEPSTNVMSTRLKQRYVDRISNRRKC